MTFGLFLSTKTFIIFVESFLLLLGDRVGQVILFLLRMYQYCHLDILVLIYDICPANHDGSCLLTTLLL